MNSISNHLLNSCQPLVIKAEAKKILLSGGGGGHVYMGKLRNYGIYFENFFMTSSSFIVNLARYPTHGWYHEFHEIYNLRSYAEYCASVLFKGNRYYFHFKNLKVPKSKLVQK